MNNGDDAANLFQSGIRAIRDKKDFAQGRKLLVQSLRLAPDNDMAWVWLSRATTDPQKRQECLARALQINPANQTALDLQRQLAGGKAASPTATKISPTERPVTRASTKTDTTTSLGARLITVETGMGQAVSKLVTIALFLFLAYGIFVGLRSGVPDDPFNLVMTIVAAIPLLGALYFLYLLVMSFGSRLELYENGLVRFYGGRRSWSWDSFTDMKVQEQTTNYRYRIFLAAIPIFSVHSFQLRLTAGRTQVIINKDFKNYRQAADIVINRVTPLVLARHQQAFHRSETLHYGPITLNQEGIGQGWRKVPWNDLADWGVENGELILRRRSNNRRVQFSISDIPNAYVLLKMIEYQRNR